MDFKLLVLEEAPKDKIYFLPNSFLCPTCNLSLGSPFYVLLYKVDTCPAGHKFTIKDLARQIGVLEL